MYVYRRVHRGGSSPLAPLPLGIPGGALPHPGIYGQRLKSGVVGKNKLALILKWMFSPLKSSLKFSLFSNFIIVFPLYLKSPPPPYLINNYSFMHYALFGMSSRNPHEGQGENTLGED